MELTCDAVRKSGNCDSGYSCAYQYNLSWHSPTQPVAPEPNPRLLFERLFGAGAPGERKESLKRRQEQQRSILDFVLDDARSLQGQLASRDRQKLDEYLGSVREIEKRIEHTERFDATPDPAVETPAGIPASFQEYIQIMYDMMILAFQTDSTRIASFLLANEGSNRAFPEIGIAEGHHFLTHHRNKQEMIEVAEECAKRLSHTKGDAVYIYSALRQLFNYPGVDVSTNGVAGVKRGRMLMITVSNGRFLGGAFKIAPHASVLDGRLDACFFSDANVVQRVRLFAGALRGTHEGMPQVVSASVQQVTLTFPSPPQMEIDGELHTASSKTVELRCYPRALSVIAAPGALL